MAFFLLHGCGGHCSRGVAAHHGASPIFDFRNRQVRNIDVHNNRFRWWVSNEPFNNSIGNCCGRFPQLTLHHVVPALAFNAHAIYCLANSNAINTSVTCSESCTNGSRVIHTAPHVCTWVNARNNKIKRCTKKSESSKHHAQGRWATQRPRLFHSINMGFMHFWLHEVQCTNSRTRTRVFAVGSNHYNFSVTVHCTSKYVQAYRVNTVIVGN